MTYHPKDRGLVRMLSEDERRDMDRMISWPERLGPVDRGRLRALGRRAGGDAEQRVQEALASRGRRGRGAR